MSTDKLRRLADAIDAMGAMIDYPNGVTEWAPGRVQVEWRDGSLAPGHAQACAAISDLVRDRWPQLWSEAIERQKKLVGDLKDELAEELGRLGIALPRSGIL